jgi:PKD repeat protein
MHIYRFLFILMIFFDCNLISIAQSSFQPPDISGLIFWIRADSGVVNNGNAIDTIFDLSGKDNIIYQTSSFKQPSIIDSVLSLNFHPVINFDGTDDYLLLMNELNTVRTLFLVLREKNGSIPNYRPILGHSIFYHFHRGDDGKTMWGGSTSNYIKQGETRLNSVLIDGVQVNVPTKYSIISIITDGNVAVDNISQDRSFTDRVWDGDIAEIIIYDTILTPTQQQQVEQYLSLKYAPPVNLGADITVSYGFCPITLSAGKPWLNSYQWNTTETTDSIVVNNSEIYSVSVLNTFNFPFSDTSICYGDTLIWNTQLDKIGYTFQWQDGSIDSVFYITQSGQYFVQVNDSLGCFRYSDTITVSIDSFAFYASLGSDTSLCSGNSIELVIGAQEATSYQWSIGSTSSSIVINNTGVYSLTVTNTNNCTAIDTISVFVQGNAPVVNFSFSGICFSDTTVFFDSSYTTDNSNIISWQWVFGDGDSAILINPSHLYASSSVYNVSLTVQTDSGCSSTSNKAITINNLPQSAFTFNEPICQNTGVVFTDNSQVVGDSIVSWQWSFGDSNSSSFQSPIHIYSITGTYAVKLITMTSNGCLDSLLKPIYVYSCVDPTAISGLQLWYSADHGVLLNGGNVEEWADKSLTQNNANQVVSSSRPTFVDSNSTLNNKPVFHFDGIDDFLSFSEIVSIRSCFFVLKHTSGDQANPVSILGHSNFYHFHGSGDKLFDGNVSNNILTGLNYVNGQLTPVLSILKPVEYSIIAILTSGDVAAQYIANDRNIAGRVWDGDYAEIIIYSDSLTSSQRQQVEQYLRFKYAPPVNLGPDIAMPNLCDTLLDAGSRFVKYVWNTGIVADTNQTLTVTKPGWYSVTVTDIFGYTSYDSVNVTYPLNQIATNNQLCLADTLVWNTNLNLSDYTFNWSTGETTERIQISEQGVYDVTVTDGSCTLVSEAITVTVDSFPVTAKLPNDTSLCAGNSIGLHTGAQQAVQYNWSNGASTNKITIDTAGIYSLTVTNAIGCMATDSINVMIKGTAPTAMFTANDVCEGDTVFFTDQSQSNDTSQVVSWQWDFGDSQTSVLQNSEHVYQTSGAYGVKLTAVTSSQCMAQFTDSVKIFSLPLAMFGNTQGNICTGQQVAFTDNSTPSQAIASWTWVFGNGQTSISQNPVQTYDSSGNYLVILTVLDTNLCSAVYQKTIKINQSPQADFIVSSACQGDTVQFIDNTLGAITSWKWDFDNNGTVDAAIANPYYIYSFAGFSMAELVVKDAFGCSDTVSKQVEIFNKPVAGFSGRDLCVNTPSQLFDTSKAQGSVITQWNWSFFNEPYASNQQNPFFTIKNTGKYFVNLQVTSYQGCSDSISNVPVYVHTLPTADFTFTPEYGNPPLNVQFTNNSADSASQYLWYFGDSLNSTSTDFSPAFNYTGNGIYTISLVAYNQYGCSDSVSKKIKVMKPLLDLAVNKITTGGSQNLMTVSAELVNLGTRDISSFDIKAKLDGKNTVKESWTGAPIISGASYVYQFNASFELASSGPAYVCVNTEFPNGEADQVTENDEYCLSFTDFKIINLYPNPTTGEINFEYSVPGSDYIEINLYDELGRIREQVFSGSATKGFNRLYLNAFNLSAGVYAIQIKYSGKSDVRKFVKK